MEIIRTVVDFILHIDIHLSQIIRSYGLAAYIILFIIIFVETGLVFTPFLPGDSLLFAAGALAALGSLNIFILLILLALAAILGDTVNYWIGHFFGEKLVANPKVPINQNHIDETSKFFAKHGGKTIVLARFVPIVRTFAPFVAGLGQMSYAKFISYNFIGGIIWAAGVTLCGYFFGNVPFIKENFSVAVIVIVLISVIPMMIPLLRKTLVKVTK